MVMRSLDHSSLLRLGDLLRLLTTSKSLIGDRLRLADRDLERESDLYTASRCETDQSLQWLKGAHRERLRLPREADRERERDLERERD